MFALCLPYSTSINKQALKCKVEKMLKGSLDSIPEVQFIFFLQLFDDFFFPFQVGVVKEAVETETGAGTKNQKYPRKS